MSWSSRRGFRGTKLKEKYLLGHETAAGLSRFFCGCPVEAQVSGIGFWGMVLHGMVDLQDDSSGECWQ